MSTASVLAAPVLALAALVGQQVPADDGPVATAPSQAAPEPVPGLDEASVDIPPAANPATEATTYPAAVGAAKTLTVKSKTMVQGETLQVVLGQRALFQLDDKGWPVLFKVEEGQLAAAHPEGEVTETFEPPPSGQIAVALDGSAEMRATVLKVWNETDKTLHYNAIALVMTRDNVTPTAAPVCAAPPRSIRIETWRRPIVAVGLGRFKETATTRACE